MDRGKFVIFPELAVLQRLLTALEREEMSPAEGHEGPIRRNSDGFPHHKDVRYPLFTTVIIVANEAS